MWLEGNPRAVCLAFGSYGSFKASSLGGGYKPEEAKVRYGRRRALQRMAGGTYPGESKKGSPTTPCTLRLESHGPVGWKLAAAALAVDAEAEEEKVFT